MRRLVIAVGIVALAGCASHATRSMEIEPAASPATREPLAGHWAGAVWETAPWYVQGHQQLDVRIDEDGHWRGTIGGRSAAGVIEHRGGQVVVIGTSRGAHGTTAPVYYRLVNGGDSLWGETATTFSERPARASVSLDRRS